MNTYVTLEQIDEAADAVRSKTSYKPRIGLILGSGLNSLADSVQNADVIPFADLPNWPYGCIHSVAYPHPWLSESVSDTQLINSVKPSKVNPAAPGCNTSPTLTCNLA